MPTKTRSSTSCSDKSNPKVFMDISIQGKNQGRIVFELFKNMVPKTAENFRSLCVGDKGTGLSGKPLHYKYSIFHRIVRGFCVQGGDFTRRNGTGGESIYGEKFEDENFAIRHDKPGILSMANAGRNTNGSQFFVTVIPTPTLNGRHVVFGQVLNGMDLVFLLNKVPVAYRMDKPYKDVVVANCGECFKYEEDTCYTEDEWHSK